MKSYIAFIAALSVACLTGYVTYHTLNIRTANHQKLTHLWTSYFDKQCANSVTKIQKKFKIPAHRMQAIQDQLNALKASDPVFNKNIPHQQASWTDPNHPVVKMTVNLLQDHKLNPNAVTIVINNEHESPAFALQRYVKSPESVITQISLNIDALSKRPVHIQEAILRHEIIHLVHYDSLEEGYLLSTLKELGHKPDYWDNTDCIIEYRHVRELRADQLAAIQGGIQTAHAFKKDFTQEACFDETISHPSSAQRIAHMNVVIDHLTRSPHSFA